MRRSFTSAALVAVMLLAACGDDGGDPAPVDNGGQQDDSGDASGGGSGASADGEDEAAATEDEPSTPDQPIDGTVDGDVIATVTADVPRGVNRDGRVPVRVDVVGLERSGDLLDLTVVMTNEDEAGDFVPYTTEWGGDAFELIDQEAQQIYLPAQDSGGACLCNTVADNMELAPGASTQLYARYGGVPDSIEAVDIQTPFHPPMSGVPISG